jgi:hypothetical protein
MRSASLPILRNLGPFLFLLLASCAGTGDVRDLGFWGLGWQFTAVQNRLQPAIPPVLAYLRARYPGIRPAEVPKAFERDFQAAILDAPADMQDRLTRRMVGAFAVSGLPCAAEGYPVREEDWSVGAFIVLDLDKLAGPPGGWLPCPPIPPGEIGERVPALRALIATLVDRQAPKRVSAVR